MSSPGAEGSEGGTIFQIVNAFIQRATRVLLTGFVIIVPFVVMAYLFDMALGFVRGALQPVIRVLEWAGIIRMANFGIVGKTLIELGFYEDVLGFFTEFVAIIVLLATIVFLGVFASFRSGKRTVEYVDAGIARIPGVGAVYRSLRRMGDVVLESGLENFRSVKLVEFPHDGLYSLAFETNQSPDSVKEITGEEDMVTLFLPLAPNPVMGGFLINVSRDRVHDIDMTVEEAGRALVTSGLAAGDAKETEEPSLNPFHRVRQANGMGDIVGGASLIYSEDEPDDKNSRE